MFYIFYVILKVIENLQRSFYTLEFYILQFSIETFVVLVKRLFKYIFLIL